MIQSRPALKGKKMILKPILLLALSVGLFPASYLAGKYAAFVQLLAVGIAAYSLYLLIKYVIPDYLYTVEDGHFTVHKINRTKSVCVADIELTDIRGKLLTKEEYKKNDVARKLFTFIKNPGDDRIRYMICNFGTEECALIIEPDEEFEKNLAIQIREWKHKKAREEDEDDE